MRAIIVIAVIVMILVIIGLKMKTWYDKITFKLSFRGIGLSAFDFNSLVSTGSTEAKLLLGFVVRNDNGFSIPFSKMKIWLYYDNTLIAESSGHLYDQSFNLPANGSIDVTDYVNVHVNSAVGKLAKDAVSNKNPKVYYTVKITVFGIPITYSDYFEAGI